MPLYEYKCSTCGVFEQNHPMLTAPKTVPCDECKGSAKKMISAIGLSQGNSARMKLIDSTQASAHEPQVVTSKPTRTSAANYTCNPLHTKLPRP